MIGRHNGWPYPESKGQVIRLGVFLGILIIMVAAIGIFVTVQSQNQPLEKSELQQMAHEFASYSSESALVAANGPKTTITPSYQQVYFEKTHEKIKQSRSQLQQQKASDNLKKQKRQLLRYSQTLDNF